HAQFHPQKSDITDAQTSHTSQEPKSPISVSSTGTLDLDPNEKINIFSQSEVVSCDCFGDLVEEELRTTSLNQEDFNSENENSNSDTEDSVTETIKDSVSVSQKSNWIESVASLSCISSLMYGCQETVQESCVRFLKNTDSLLHQIQTKKPKVNDASSCQVSVEHDPGLRGEVCGENQKKYLIEHGPFQPKLSCFPANQDISQGKQNRFSPRWYNEYPHLEYSIKKDAVFCFVCSLFHDTPSKEKADPSWISTGVRKWHNMKSVGKNKQGKLAQHFSSQSHKASLAAYCHYFLKTTKHVDIQLDKAKRAAQIQEAEDLEYNRKVIHILLDIARTLARQALPFRGDSNEEGNLYQLVLLSQNEFIALLEAELREKVVEEVKSAVMFSVMADTTPDEEHTDRLSVVLRYVNDAGKPTERLLDVRETVDKTGLGQAKDILFTIEQCGVDSNDLRFQSYDFAAAMSGEFNGAQQKLSEIVGRDIPYIPCQAHRCNTVIEHSCNASVIVREMFDILQALFVFFTSSTKHFQPLKEEITKVENCLMLRNLSKTRWSARAESIQAVWTSLDVIVDVLQQITK
ncbi:zinc finger MYM-type 1-like, partial [Paramuricea clavata]